MKKPPEARQVWRMLRQKAIEEGANAAHEAFASGANSYEVPTHDRYLAQSIAVALRNRGFPARSEGSFVRASPAEPRSEPMDL